MLISAVPVTLVFLATELPRLQEALLTTSLTGPQWLACIGLAAVLPAVIEGSKWVRRRRAATSEVPMDPRRAVAPQRAVAEMVS